MLITDLDEIVRQVLADTRTTNCKRRVADGLHNNIVAERRRLNDIRVKRSQPLLSEVYVDSAHGSVTESRPLHTPIEPKRARTAYAKTHASEELSVTSLRLC